MTEEQIERRAEAKFDALDRNLMGGTISQADYDKEVLRVAEWAESAHRAREMAEGRAQ